MIIDFHTHVFPDNLAPRAMEVLAAGIDNLYPPVSDGTLAGLLHNMDKWSIAISVVQPVITKQPQFKKTNEWVASICSDKIMGFGAVFPHTDDYKRDIDFVVSLGLKGLKFHAEYQDFCVDDLRMLEIYDYALSRGLILLHHAGFDPAFLPPFHSSPQRFSKVVQAMKGGVIVLAHLGGHQQWSDVEKYLAGSNVYLDTSMGFDYFPHEQFLRIVEKHGTDKILFASDAPWSNAKSEIEQLRALPISDDDISAILSGNAKRILNLISG
ncbi:MAG: amidohydrolase family protein [Dehalococcoidia bacterium]|nr:amidohydrolase family protein [Dehalococcoidia bacterium]